MKLLSRLVGSRRRGLAQGPLVVGLLVAFGCSLPALAQEDSRAVRLPSQKPISVASEVGIGDLYALVVGVAQYRNPKVPKLNFSDKDARAFAEFLSSQKSLFRKIHLTLLVNEQASQQEVKKHLFYELRRAGKNDTVVLFFAGHGLDDPNQPGEFFFMTHDADPDFLEATAVNMTRSPFMQRLDSKRVVAIADTCYAGGFSSQGARSIDSSLNKLINQFKESEGRVFLSSCRPDQISKEAPELSSGVFTYYFLEGLKGKADSNGDGVVTLQEAYEYVYGKAKDHTRGGQHAQLAGQFVGAFPLSVVGRREGTPPASASPGADTGFSPGGNGGPLAVYGRIGS